ncbi:MAG: hypothetical protein MJ231_02360 [bacterium]|nr:hypothetical protein [bacterium]
MLAASQARYFFLSDRKHDIEVTEQRISNEKISLARDSERVYQDYNNALKQKRLKFSNNAGYNYTDVSYSNLMRPGTMNLNEPYLVTDMQGKIVVDEKYLEYAQRISPNGYAGGDWSSSTRAEILSQLTGISKDKILGADTTATGMSDAEQKYYDVLAEQPFYSANSDVEGLLRNMTSKIEGKSWDVAYQAEDFEVALGNGSAAVSNLKMYINQLTNELAKCFPDQEAYKKGCEDAMKSIMQEETMMSGKELSGYLHGDQNGYSVNVKDLVDAFVTFLTNEDGNLEWVDTTSPEYKQWQTDNADWEKRYEEALANYSNSIESNNTLLTSEQEALILFYDKIFSAIAENGWTYNDQVSDTKYLNEVLQNGNYSITRVSRLEEYNEKSGEIVRNNDYETDIATNFDNIVTVSDTEIREEAYIKYQHEKSIIDKKETKLDTKMKDLDTELSAINQMMEAIQNTMGEAIDKNFSIMS